MMRGRSPVSRRTDLSAPRDSGGRGLSVDPDAFGRFAEGIARYFGTARFLVLQTVLVAGWITANVLLVAYRWDPYPFILLNLAFSTQAAYAAPLILLAQNRQEMRDRVQSENDRRVAERTQADAEFLAREIASVRVALSDVVTGRDLREIHDQLERLSDRLESALPEPGLGDAGSDDPGVSDPGVDDTRRSDR